MTFTIFPLLLENSDPITLEIGQNYKGITPAVYVFELLKPHMDANGFESFVNHMPDKPDRAIAIYDLPFGRQEDRRMRTGEVDEHPVVQILARDTRFDAVEALQGAWGVMEQVYNQVFSDGKIMRCITKTNTIASLGQEPKTRRCLFSQQFRMTLE
jgi:hypothetical protein